MHKSELSRDRYTRNLTKREANMISLQVNKLCIYEQIIFRAEYKDCNLCVSYGTEILKIPGCIFTYTDIFLETCLLCPCQACPDTLTKLKKLRMSQCCLPR